MLCSVLARRHRELEPPLSPVCIGTRLLPAWFSLYSSPLSACLQSQTHAPFRHYPRLSCQSVPSAFTFLPCIFLTPCMLTSFSSSPPKWFFLKSTASLACAHWRWDTPVKTDSFPLPCCFQESHVGWALGKGEVHRTTWTYIKISLSLDTKTAAPVELEFLPMASTGKPCGLVTVIFEMKIEGRVS